MSKETTEVRFKIDKDYIKSLMKAMDARSANEVTQEALTLLDWIIEESREGRVILSSDRQGGDLHRLVSPALSRVKPERPTET